MKNLLVMKFGGTSMGSAERIKVAARIVSEEQKKRPVVVVVSAMSKITDLLLDTMRHAEAGNRAATDSSLAALRQRHEETCRELLPAERQAAGEARIGELIGEFERIVNGMAMLGERPPRPGGEWGAGGGEAAGGARIGELIGEFERIVNGMAMLGERPPRSVDEAVVTGEWLSAVLMAEYLTGDGTPAEAVNAREAVVTDAMFGNASPLMEPTTVKARARLLPFLERGTLPVVTGFNGATADGRATTLGRGGSDFSASILAAALDAAELWIWTDVDGIMSADRS